MNKVELYKLTDKNGQTYGGCQWGENVTNSTSGRGDLCGPGWTHWYLHPLLAVFLNPLHGDFDLNSAILWRGEGTIGKSDRGKKVGCADGTTISQIPLPNVSTEQKVAFGILCALSLPQSPTFTTWARNWLSGVDRTLDAAKIALGSLAWEAASKAVATASKAADTASKAALKAASAALKAAAAAATAEEASEASSIASKAAVSAAEAAAAAATAVSASDALATAMVEEAWARARAAESSAEASARVADVGIEIDLIALAEKAMEY
jgi:hypothetical protein